MQLHRRNWKQLQWGHHVTTFTFDEIGGGILSVRRPSCSTGKEDTGSTTHFQLLTSTDLPSAPHLTLVLDKAEKGRSMEQTLRYTWVRGAPVAPCKGRRENLACHIWHQENMACCSPYDSKQGRTLPSQHWPAKLFWEGHMWGRKAIVLCSSSVLCLFCNSGCIAFECEFSNYFFHNHPVMQICA